MTTIRTIAVFASVMAALTIGPALAGDIVGKVKYAGTAPPPCQDPGDQGPGGVRQGRALR